MEAPPDQDVHSSSSSSRGGYPDTFAAATAAVLKRKRKRTNHPSPLPRAIATEEEEDMAHCLILLARGRGLDSSSSSPEKFTSRKFTEAVTTAGGKAGFYVYECKTCSKCFPSFQALGGHRASHKKPKLQCPSTVAGTSMATDDETVQITDDGLSNAFSAKSNASPAAAANSPTAGSCNINNKARVHECSVCGAEFSSGQALGGHMRRHRPIGPPPEPQEVKKERNVLSLDLNLPAPSDDNTLVAPAPPVPAFSFANKRPMVFSPTSPLVHCHY